MYIIDIPAHEVGWFRYTNHNLSCIRCLLLHTSLRHDIFHPGRLFQPLLAYQHMLIIPTQLLFSSNMSATLFPGLNKSEQDLAHKFPDTSFWNFWICLQATGYHSAHTGHDIDLYLVILNLARLSWRAINQRLCCSHLLGCCEIPSLWVMKFHWTLLSDPISIMDKHLLVIHYLCNHLSYYVDVV